jgi:hypothetical protein
MNATRATLRGLDTTGITELICETIEADGMRCSECGDTAPGDKLLIYVTKRGANRRTHNGQFCSRPCHDRFHGLAPQGGRP